MVGADVLTCSLFYNDDKCDVKVFKRYHEKSDILCCFV